MHRITVVLITAVALALAGVVAAPSPTPARASLPAISVDPGTTAPLAARGARGARGGGFGTRSRSVRPRETARQRAARRARNRGIAGSVLRALGIAWLFSALFGLGAGGGSPFGLLIIGALVLWLVMRSRRTRQRRSAFGY